MTLMELKQILNKLKEFYNNSEKLSIEINKTYKKLSENISSDLDKMILGTFKGYAENLKIQVGILNREVKRLKNNRIKGRNVFDRIERNRKKLIKNLSKIFNKKNIKDKAKIANQRLRGEYNSIKRIVKNSAHRIKEKTKDFFFKKASKIVKLEKVWTCIFKNSRDAHKEMHKQIADKKGYFTAPNGKKTKTPGGFGIAELDINCNCYIKIRKVRI